jgi:hypothetical protein
MKLRIEEELAVERAVRQAHGDLRAGLGSAEDMRAAIRVDDLSVPLRTNDFSM